MASPRHELAQTAATAWDRYDSAVRFGGSRDERRYAFSVALRAERKLAEYDAAQRPRKVREAAARALSGR